MLSGGKVDVDGIFPSPNSLVEKTRDIVAGFLSFAFPFRWVVEKKMPSLFIEDK
jgi:hypothetical protein